MQAAMPWFEPAPKVKRGRKPNTGPVPPCAKCGTTQGPTKVAGGRPLRTKGTRFGQPDKLFCETCYGWLKRRAERPDMPDDTAPFRPSRARIARMAAKIKARKECKPHRFVDHRENRQAELAEQASRERSSARHDRSMRMQECFR